MTSERRVMELFERANPIPDPDTYVVEPDPDRIMQDDRDPMITIDPTNEHSPRSRHRWLLPAIAAAAVVVIVVAGLIVFAGDDDAPIPADTPAPVTTVPPSSTTPDAVDELDATDVVAGFFDAFNSGDIDAVLAHLTDDVVVRENLQDDLDAAPVIDFRGLDAARQRLLGPTERPWWTASTTPSMRWPRR
jgi:hypothetical protein